MGTIKKKVGVCQSFDCSVQTIAESITFHSIRIKKTDNRDRSILRLFWQAHYKANWWKAEFTDYLSSLAGLIGSHTSGFRKSLVWWRSLFRQKFIKARNFCPYEVRDHCTAVRRQTPIRARIHGSRCSCLKVSSWRFYSTIRRMLNSQMEVAGLSACFRFPQAQADRPPPITTKSDGKPLCCRSSCMWHDPSRFNRLHSCNSRDNRRDLEFGVKTIASGIWKIYTSIASTPFIQERKPYLR